MTNPHETLKADRVVVLADGRNLPPKRDFGSVRGKQLEPVNRARYRHPKKLNDQIQAFKLLSCDNASAVS